MPRSGTALATPRPELVAVAPGRLARLEAQNAPAILVLGDDRLAGETALRVLRSAGYRARAVGAAPGHLEAAAWADLACVVLELTPEGGGIELMAEFARHGRAASFVFLCGCADVRATAQAMRLGAVDVLETPVVEGELLDAVARAVEKTAQGRALQAERDDALARLARLTTAERKVCEHLGVGLRNKEVAAALGRSEQTIKVHAWRALKKLKVGSAVEVARLLAAAGALPGGGCGGKRAMSSVA